MKTIELLGLPAAGKSYFVRNKKNEIKKIVDCYNVSLQLVESGISFKKIKNISAGALFLFFLNPCLFLGSFFFYDNKILLLCERIGRVKSSSGVFLDEGVVQACWALLLNGKSRSCRGLVLNLIKKLSNDGSFIIYVSSNKGLIFERAQKRFKKNPKISYSYQSVENYTRSRDVMACLLKILRDFDMSLKYIRN